MADADDFDLFFLTSEVLANGFGLGLDSTSRCFLFEDIAILNMIEGEEGDINCLLQALDESIHPRWRGEYACY